MAPTSIPNVSVPRLRVLVVDGGEPPCVALTEWLIDEAVFEVRGPATSTDAGIAIAAKFRPQVVLLDYHAVPLSVNYTVALLKELVPAPRVFLLTHDCSAATRRRCGTARVDAVFDKTAELDALLAALVAMAPKHQSAERP